MKPAVAFVIRRKNFYRHLAPVIARVLEQGGWRVECWHDTDFHYAAPGRPFDWAHVGDSPFYGRPEVRFREFKNDRGFAGLLAEVPVDVVVALHEPPAGFVQMPHRPRYALIEPFFYDTFSRFPAPATLRGIDSLVMGTRYWLDKAVEFLGGQFGYPLTAELRDEIYHKAVIAGSMYHEHLPLVDPDGVRRRFRLPAGRRVVVMLNWFEMSFLGVRQAAFQAVQLRRKLKMARDYRGCLREALRWLGQPNQLAYTRAVRQFCDANNALLVVKSRSRDKVKPYVARYADRVVYDESFYPSTIMELLSVADCCIGMHSSVITEAVLSGVPYVLLDVAGFSDCCTYGERRPLNRLLAQEGGYANFPGAVHLLSEEAALRELPSAPLSRFTSDPGARARFIETYVTPAAVTPSQRVLEALEGLCATGSGHGH